MLSAEETDPTTFKVVGQDITEFNVAPSQAHLIETVDLSFNALQSVYGLEGFRSLRELVLDNNRLGDDIVLPALPKLQTLSLNKNRICHIESLLKKIKVSSPHLEFLSLLGNSACPNELMCGDEEDYQNYRYIVIQALQSLRFLDSRKISPGERAEAQRKAPFVKVMKALEADNIVEPELPDYFSPLEEQQDMDRKSMFGKRRYFYQGRNSEGNRFINNDDL